MTCALPLSTEETPDIYPEVRKETFPFWPQNKVLKTIKKVIILEVEDRVATHSKLDLNSLTSVATHFMAVPRK